LLFNLTLLSHHLTSLRAALTRSTYTILAFDTCRYRVLPLC
jgi:hypothetical protein